MWLFIWLVLSLIILGVFAWSLQTLWQQKRAWAAFAKRHGFQYNVGRFMDSPYIEGTMNGRRVAVFSDRKSTLDVRGERYVSVIAIMFGQPGATAGVVASPAMEPYLDTLSFSEVYAPDVKGWAADYIVRGRDKAALKAHLTPERLAVLAKLLAMKNAEIVYLFDDEDTALRVETRDPLRSADQLEKMIAQFLKAVDKLAVPSDALQEQEPAETDQNSAAPEKEKP